MFFADTDNQFKLISMIEYSNTRVLYNTVRHRSFDILSFRLQGNAEYTFRDQTLSLTTNDLLFIPGHTRYSLRSENEHLIVFHFETTGPHPLIPEKYTPCNPAVFQSAFEAAISEWSARRPGYYQRTTAHLYKILAEMNLQFDPAYNTASYHRIKDALDYLHYHYRDPALSIEQLCRICHLSDTQFRKYFRDVYGTTPINHLNRLRTDYAAELLLNTDHSVEQIAEESGFSDAKYFTYVFKKYHDRSPISLRLGK